MPRFMRPVAMPSVSLDATR